MRIPLVLLALLAVPTHAQETEVYYASETWPVSRDGSSCSMIRAGAAETGFGRLSVSYNAARNEVTLATRETARTSLPAGVTVRLHLVFLDNGRIKHDDQWGSRQFTYTSTEDGHTFATVFAGDRNVRQILGDLANSRRFGLIHDGEVVFDHDLAGVRGSLARLRECAARTAAAN